MSILDQAPLVDDLATECAEKVCGQANAAEVIFEYMVKVIELAEPQAHAAGAAAEKARCVAVIEQVPAFAGMPLPAVLNKRIADYLKGDK